MVSKVNIYNGKIETFVVLATVESLELANRISAAFEDINIPILLEHVDSLGATGRSAYRISTLTHYSENASRIVDNIIITAETQAVTSSKFANS